MRSLSLRVAFLALAVASGAPARAQRPAPPRGPAHRLSLDDALRLAETQNDAIDIARAGVTRAVGQQYQARSQYLPQLSGTGGYTKTLKSQFSGLVSAAADSGPPAPPSLCAPRIASTATQAERNAALAQAQTCPSGPSIDFSKAGFGAKNQWTLGLQLSQNVFTGGRVAAQAQAAEAGVRSANIEVAAQRAQAMLDVTQAYYDAVLADQLVSIADSSLVQTEEVFRQTKLAREVGNQSEFDLLRAQVTRDNQRPAVIQARSNRDVAYLRLKQLLNVSLDDALELTTRLDAPAGPALPVIATAATAAPDTMVSDRAPVRELEQAVRAQEAQVAIARSERFPSLALVSGYQRLYFPNGTFPNLSDARENWTIGLSTNFSLFSGGRIKGGELIAQAGLDQARAQLRQTREFVALDTRVALSALAQAEAAWDASRGTAEQARRAYSIDQVRYSEGISTQTDLAQSRLLLEQATAIRAQAARDLAVARVRLALLKDLPLQASGGANRGAAQQQPQQSPQPSRSAQTNSVGPTGAQP
jgi:outer membrane protein TolC